MTMKRNTLGKKLFILARIVIFIVIGMSGIQAQTSVSCVRTVSTNPINPFNTEWPYLFPGKTAKFTNTFFSWYPPPFGPPTLIDKSQNWATPYAGQTGVISMASPFRDENGYGSDYLQNGFLEFRDWHWEDGWELLYMNLGFYPNGDKIDQTDVNHYISDIYQIDPIPNNAPYFILYNRFTGVLRVFANVWFTDNSIGTQEDIVISLELDGTVLTADKETSFSGLLRHAEGLDFPLDQNTRTTSVSSPRRHPFKGSNTNVNQWVAADFQMAYDPCQCAIPTKLVFKFSTRDNLNADLNIREISYNKDLDDLNDFEKDYFQSMLDADGEIVAAGNVAYESLNGLLEDYKDALDLYNTQLADYNNPLNQIKKLVVDLAQDAIPGFGTALIPTGVLADYVKNSQFGVWGEHYPTDKDVKGWTGQINKTTKKLLADEFDFLNVVLNIQEKPSKPQIPQATFSEGRIVGQITKNYSFASEPLFVPGTLPSADIDKTSRTTILHPTPRR